VKREANVRAAFVLTHDDGACQPGVYNTPLITKDGGRYCPVCKIHPDMQSTCFVYYCPNDMIPLKGDTCPKCKNKFIRKI
jgi:hypothetical protein